MQTFELVTAAYDKLGKNFNESFSLSVPASYVSEAELRKERVPQKQPSEMTLKVFIAIVNSFINLIINFPIIIRNNISSETVLVDHYY